jgi:hypothetical protein
MLAINASTGNTDKVVAVDLTAYGQKAVGAAARAINRSMTSARAVMAREISKATGLKIGDAKLNHLGLTVATEGRPSSTLSLQRAMVPAIKLKAKGRNPSRAIPGGVSYRLGGQDINRASAFMVTFENGHTAVYERLGRERLPIKEVKEDISPVFESAIPVTLQKVNEVMPGNFEHELGRL